LLQRGAKAGLTLEQIGSILCRPDDDDQVPSLLERIVDKARLIADMLVKMQSKSKDSQLRDIKNKVFFKDLELGGGEGKKKNLSTIGGGGGADEKL